MGGRQPPLLMTARAGGAAPIKVRRKSRIRQEQPPALRAEEGRPIADAPPLFRRCHQRSSSSSPSSPSEDSERASAFLLARVISRMKINPFSATTTTTLLRGKKIDRFCVAAAEAEAAVAPIWSDESVRPSVGRFSRPKCILHFPSAAKQQIGISR